MSKDEVGQHLIVSYLGLKAAAHARKTLLATGFSDATPGGDLDGSLLLVVI